MPQILQTQNFTIVAPDEPHHCKTNGGHIKIALNTRYDHYFQVPASIQAQLAYCKSLVGEAITNFHTKKGTGIARINYQNNGNWGYKPNWPNPIHVHEHLYIRSHSEKHPTGDKRFQAFPEGLIFPPKESGYYDSFQPFSETECQQIKQEIQTLLKSEKYAHLDL